MGERYFSTFETSRMLRVHHTTVEKWFDAGKLGGFVTPGGHRRIRESSLASFAAGCGIPIPREIAGMRCIRALLVDDDWNVSSVIKQGLEQEAGIEVFVADEGEEAASRVREIRPETVILDIFLPGTDGMELCSTIRRICGESFLVAITGYSVDHLRERIFSAGADEFLKKPFPVADLVELVRRRFFCRRTG